MSDIKEQIFNELAKLDEEIMRLKSTAINAEKQTDLEVAILTEQVKNLRTKNIRANELIEQSVKILETLK